MRNLPLEAREYIEMEVDLSCEAKLPLFMRVDTDNCQQEDDLR